MKNVVKSMVHMLAGYIQKLAFLEDESALHTIIYDLPLSTCRMAQDEAQGAAGLASAASFPQAYRLGLALLILEGKIKHSDLTDAMYLYRDHRGRPESLVYQVVEIESLRRRCNVHPHQKEEES